MDKTFYFISGLGADERLFRNLDMRGSRCVYVSWIKPLPDESLTGYALRLAGQIKEQQGAVLVGVSLGGILSVEIAKRMNISAAIIISSVKTRDELPLSYRLLSYVSFVVRLFPYSIIRRIPFLLYYHMGARTREEIELLQDFMRKTDESFVHWASEKIICWQNREVPANVFHIHGTEDRVFPFSKVKNAVGIKGGTHLMVLNRARKISRLILELSGGLKVAEEKS
jgi:pimeloyl-ACP methyl ester carboxylesterase